MAHILVLYGTPDDPAEFDRYYREQHMPIAARIPGLRSMTISQGPVQALAGTAPYLTAILEFESLEDAQVALASPEGGETANDLQNFATGGATILLYETEMV